MFIGKGLLAAMFATASIRPPGRSLDFRPYATKDLGRNHLKSCRTSKYMPHQGRRECERRMRQRQKAEARAAAQS